MNRRRFMYFLKQKLYGLLLIVLGIITPFILDGDATASILVIPLGLYIVFTKEMVM